MTPTKVLINPMISRDLESSRPYASYTSLKRSRLPVRTRTSSNLSSIRGGRLRAELTVSDHWSYFKYGKENAGGHEPPRGDPGGRDRWNAP